MFNVKDNQLLLKNATGGGRRKRRFMRSGAQVVKAFLATELRALWWGHRIFTHEQAAHAASHDRKVELTTDVTWSELR